MKLTDFYSGRFLPSSHAYQHGKGINSAVAQAKTYVESGAEFVVEIDIRSFFDDISISRIIDLLKADKHDHRVIALIESFLRCRVCRDGEIYHKEKGLIQGASMSPVLSNWYLQELDEFMEKQNYKWIRFADDIYVYTDSEEKGSEIYSTIERQLEERFELSLNEQKSGIFSVYSRRILGYDFYKKGKSFRVEKHIYKEQDYYRNWHASAIEKVNKEYHVISSGILNKKDYALLFENEEKKHHIPVEATEQINVYNEITIISAVFRTLNNEKVRMGLYDKFGTLIGYFIPESYTQDIKTLLAQCKVYSDEKKRVGIAKKIEIAAIHNIRANIRYYKKHHQDEKLIWAEQQLTQGIVKMNSCKQINDLLLEEARCRQLYYQTFNTILNDETFYFEKRTKRPPMDCINALISFGNTLLYNRIQSIIWKTTLDSRIGIFHAANKRHYSLNLDFADLFKPITVDRVIFSLINRGQLTSSAFVKNADESVYLSSTGKKLFIQAFNDKMGSKLTVNNKTITYYQLIEQEIRCYLDYLVDGKKYKPYKYY